MKDLKHACLQTHSHLKQNLRVWIWGNIFSPFASPLSGMPSRYPFANQPLLINSKTHTTNSKKINLPRKKKKKTKKKQKKKQKPPTDLAYRAKFWHLSLFGTGCIVSVLPNCALSTTRQILVLPNLILPTFQYRITASLVFNWIRKYPLLRRARFSRNDGQMS